MGHSIVKYRLGDEEQWGLKQGDAVSTLVSQPASLSDLIKQQDRFLHVDNQSSENLKFADLTLLAPVTQPVKVVCQGLNYATHREEAALRAASNGNVMFSKDDSAITGAHSPVIRPLNCECLDYEVELGLIIRNDISEPATITEDDLPDYIAGLVLANDMSPRDLQYRDDYAQWFKAKSCRTMLPLGPVLYLLSRDDFQALNDLRLQLWVNDQLRQDANTSEMIFKPAPTLTEIASFMNLRTGDIVLTGTPGGVIVKAPSKFVQGLGTWLLTNEKKVEVFRKKKADYLQDGDVVRAHISSADGSIDLGYQQNTIQPR